MNYFHCDLDQSIGIISVCCKLWPCCASKFTSFNGLEFSNVKSKII